MLPVLSPDQAADWDRRAEAAGIELATLMECAGRAAATVIADRYASQLHRGVLIAAGLGNNGGDGWVLARALHRAGVSVWVAPLPGDGSALQRRVAALGRADGVREVAPEGPWPTVGLAVDALLGTGARGAPRAPVAALLHRLTDLAVPLVAIDGPTGLDLATGVIHGPARADLSITFGGVRRGHLLARDEAGHIIVVDIGHPPPPPGWPALATDLEAATWLPRLHAGDHKGVRGRVVVVGGAPGMSGALRMACRAAFGMGAGLVHAVAPPETVAMLAGAEPDLQTFAHDFDAAPNDRLCELLARADAVVIGPGLGRGPGRREFVAAIVGASRRVVLDADALTVFQGAVSDLGRLMEARAGLLTPHPGEFRTLFPELAAERELDPWSAAAAAAELVGGVVLLKGVPTVVARPGAPLLTIAAGNPGLATGGSGDLLSGFVGVGLAQGLEPGLAAALGAHTLGRAGDIAARRVTARSLRPMDVVAALPDLWREWQIIGTVPPAPRPPVLWTLEAPRRV